MSKLKFNVRDDLVQPEYPCSKADKAISVHEHGVTWCIWKLQDMTQKHMRDCKACKDAILDAEEKELRDYFKGLTESARKHAEDIMRRLEQIQWAVAIKALGEFLGAHMVAPEEIRAVVEVEV